MRKTKLTTGFIYHVYNRGTDKREIFMDTKDYSRFLSILEHYINYNYPYSILQKRLKLAKNKNKKKQILELLELYWVNPQVEIISFCLMPNHYHLTLKQLTNKGISEFLHRIGTSYTKYLNIKYKRTGRLFEGTFKAVQVKSDEQLVHLTRYQHINPKKLVDSVYELINYPWSSLSTFMNAEQVFKFVSPKIVLHFYQNSNKYLDFVLAEIDEELIYRLSDVAIDDDFGWFYEYRSSKNEIKEYNLDEYSKRIMRD